MLVFCSAFNSINPNQRWKKSNFLANTADVFDFSGALAPITIGQGENQGRMEFILDAHNMESFGSIDGHFQIGVYHASDSIALIQGSGMGVWPGQIASFYITVSRVEADKSLEQWSPDKRNCRFQSEVTSLPSDYPFNWYSEAGCLFDCKLRQA